MKEVQMNPAQVFLKHLIEKKNPYDRSWEPNGYPGGFNKPLVTSIAEKVLSGEYTVEEGLRRLDNCR